MKKEKLPRGFWRAPNGSLRVLIRVTGWPPAVRTFKLYADTPEERRRQLTEAEVWAAEARRKLYGGHGLASGDSHSLTLGDALRRYAREGLSSRVANRRKDERRIAAILEDKIASRRLASLSLPDLAAYRDLLIERDFERRIRRAAKAADSSVEGRARRAMLRRLLELRRGARLGGGGGGGGVARKTLAARSPRFRPRRASGRSPAPRLRTGCSSSIAP